MRWIQKGREPRLLAQYRNGPAASWDGLPKDEKISIQEALLKEQGHLCAYCMRRIERSGSRRNMKIEHWKPRNLLSEEEKLNYYNMLGVCEGHIRLDAASAGKSGKDTIEDTCDTLKGGEEITVDPRRKDHIDSIYYEIQDDTGRALIKSRNPAIHEDLEKRLNLNAGQFQKNRYELLDELIEQLKAAREAGTWSAGLLDRFRSRYTTPNHDGRLPEYAGFLLWWLDRRRRRTQ